MQHCSGFGGRTGAPEGLELDWEPINPALSTNNRICFLPVTSRQKFRCELLFANNNRKGGKPVLFQAGTLRVLVAFPALKGLQRLLAVASSEDKTTR